MEIKCLYQDERLVVCLKPPGIRSTDEPGGLLDLLRRQMDGENENTSLRTVHRLDQVAGGVMVIARSRVAAQLLSAQISDRNFQKEYLAVVEGTPASPEGEFRDLLARDRAKRRTYVTTHPGKGVREAVAADGFFGALTGGLTASAGGITVAIVAALLAGLLSKSAEK